MTKVSRVVMILACSVWTASAFAQNQGAAASGREMQRFGRAATAEKPTMPAPQGFSVVLVLGEMQATGAADTVPPAARKALTDMKDFLPYKNYRLLDTQWTLCCGHSGVLTRLRGPEEQDYDLELFPTPTATSGKWSVRFALRDPGGSDVGGAADEAGRVVALSAQRAQLENHLRDLRKRGYADGHPEVQQTRARLADIQREQSMHEQQNQLRRTARAASVAAQRQRAIIDTSFTMDIGETVVVGTSRLKGDKALIAVLTAVASTRPAAR